MRRYSIVGSKGIQGNERRYWRNWRNGIKVYCVPLWSVELINFVVMQGVTGEQGPPGNKGERGLKGANGENGERGRKGRKGNSVGL